MAIECGVLFGYNRAHKHVESPTQEQLVSAITDAVTNEICEWFDFNDGSETGAAP